MAPTTGEGNGVNRQDHVRVDRMLATKNADADEKPDNRHLDRQTVYTNKMQRALSPPSTTTLRPS